MALQWEPYFLRGPDQFDAFWEQHLSTPRNLLLIGGIGFDPRTCMATSRLLAFAGEGRRDFLFLNYDEGENSPSHEMAQRVDENRRTLTKLVSTRGSVTESTIRIWAKQGSRRRRVGPREAQNAAPSLETMCNYTDVIVDVSAMPKGIMFPFLGRVLKTLQMANGTPPLPNLFVVVAENASLDKRIEEVGPDEEAVFIPGFGTELENEATRDVPRIWIPVLGEGAKHSLDKIHEEVEPSAIAPVLPHPSRDPRRADDLISEYRSQLIDAWKIDPRNILYGAEANPFEVYRQIVRAAERYHRSLKVLGGCKVAVSSSSSKLLSIGAMLAVLELKDRGRPTGLAHVEVQGYRTDESAFDEAVVAQSQLHTLGLFGEMYSA